MDQIAKLEKIQYSPAKGATIEVKKIRIHPDFGIAEDYHSAQGDARLILWEAETRLRLERESFDGLCFPRFKEQLSISGLELKKLEVGSLLKINGTRIKILKKGKGCHPECKINRNGAPCPLKNGIVYAEVLEEGIIKQGDEVTI